MRWFNPSRYLSHRRGAWDSRCTCYWSPIASCWEQSISLDSSIRNVNVHVGNVILHCYVPFCLLQGSILLIKEARLRHRNILLGWLRFSFNLLNNWICMEEVLCASSWTPRRSLSSLTYQLSISSGRSNSLPILCSEPTLWSWLIWMKPSQWPSLYGNTRLWSIRGEELLIEKHQHWLITQQ